MTGLRLENVTKSFGTNKVLDDVSLSLESGELLVLLGPSGCGKSTLLRLIAGLEALDSGKIYINDQRVDELSPKERQVAMVFQNYSLYPHMTVEKNLAFPLKISRLPRQEISAKVQEVAAMLDLTDKLQQRPAQLSGGQRQRVALGRAVIRKPSLFLLDEPLSNLDADLRVRMRTEIVRIQQELAVTTVHVTHDQAEALTMADRIALLNKGRVEQTGTPEELYTQPGSTFVAQFIGQPRMNLIPASFKNGQITPFGLSEIPDRAKASGEFLIGIRPEVITIGPGGEYSGKVVYTEYLGDHYMVKIECAGAVITATRDGGTYGVGDPVSFSFPTSSVYFFDRVTGHRIDH